MNSDSPFQITPTGYYEYNPNYQPRNHDEVMIGVSSSPEIDAFNQCVISSLLMLALQTAILLLLMVAAGHKPLIKKWFRAL